MSSIRFSVVMPVFNREAYLRETLDSIMAQTYTPAEIVVVDDGSTDGSWDIIQSYGNTLRTRRIENSGAGNARKTGVDLSTCPWIAFCDSDDLWLPNHLERRAGMIERYPEAEFTFSNNTPFGPAARPGLNYFHDGPEGWWDTIESADEDGYRTIDQSYRRFLRFNPALTSTIAITRELYERMGGISPEYSRLPAEDSDLTRKAVALGRVCCDAAVTAKQRRHDQNMSAVEVESLVGKFTILQHHLERGITPTSDIQDTREEVKITLHEAILGAFYKRNYASVKPLEGRFSLWRLPASVLIRLLYLRIFVA